METSEKSNRVGKNEIISFFFLRLKNKVILFQFGLLIDMNEFDLSKNDFLKFQIGSFQSLS